MGLSYKKHSFAAAAAAGNPVGNHVRVFHTNTAFVRVNLFCLSLSLSLSFYWNALSIFSATPTTECIYIQLRGPSRVQTGARYTFSRTTRENTRSDVQRASRRRIKENPSRAKHGLALSESLFFHLRVYTYVYTIIKKYLPVRRVYIHVYLFIPLPDTPPALDGAAFTRGSCARAHNV